MDDGRTTPRDAGPWVYYKLTYEPSAQVSLKKGSAVVGNNFVIEMLFLAFCDLCNCSLNLKSLFNSTLSIVECMYLCQFLAL